MTPEYYGKKPSDPQKKRWESGSQLRRWRLERGLSAKRLAELVEVTERSIHRAERGRKVGARIRVAMKLLESRIASGEVVIIGEKRVLERMRRSKGHDLILREPTAKYGSEWHGKLRTGADIRVWRKSVGLYVKELAALLGVVGPSVMRAERSESPSSRIVYGVELLRAKVLSGELDLRVITQDRVRRGRPKKE
jgi:transcriptional regulator with XRE-family HTH domain